MFPELVTLGPFTLHTYGLFVALGFLAGLLVATRIAGSQGIPSQTILDMAFVMILSGIVVSRLFYVFIDLPHFFRHPLDVFRIWEGGLVFSGGILGAAGAMVWYVRKRGLGLWEICDIFAPAAAIGQAIGRVGCLMAGCCYGLPTKAWWGITFSHPKCLAPTGIALHPTQVYEVLAGLGIFLVLLALSARRRYTGQVLLWYLILHSTLRLWVERYRGDDRGLVFGGPMTLTQLVALAILACAVAMVLYRSRAEAKKRVNTRGS